MEAARVSRSLLTFRRQAIGGIARRKSTAVSLESSVPTDHDSTPTLKKVPTLPFVGSFISSYSGTPEYSDSTSLAFWPEMKRRFGTFYRMGMPGIGDGLHGTMYVVHDPTEMMKILRHEGEFPVGSTSHIWPPFEFDKRHHGELSVGTKLLSKGTEWKRLRRFVQTDLLSPKSARQYLPAALEAARLSSKNAPNFADNMNEYLNLASFDMFVNILLGHLPAITDPTTEKLPEDVEFCNTVAQGLRTLQQLSMSPYQKMMVKTFGIETNLYKKFHSNWARAVAISFKKVQDLKAARTQGILTDTQENSYINRAFDRLETDGTVTEEEAEALASGLLQAGVDTTGNFLTWKLLHVAMNYEVQEKLYQELKAVADPETGLLTPESVAPSNTPYLHAVMRESHRCANPASTVPIKRIDKEITVHGVALPAGSVVTLDAYSTGIDPELVEDPMEFRPERFLDDAVTARKGTPSEVIDHPFFSGPFSQGARRCPGSRVANMEAHVFVAQIVLDWKMDIPSLGHWTDCGYRMDTLPVAVLPRMTFTPRS